jgi:transposase
LKDQHLTSFSGLILLQHSSGGKAVFGRISKRGDVYLRTLLIHGGTPDLALSSMRLDGVVDKAQVGTAAG